MCVSNLPKVATQWNNGTTRDSNRGRQVLIPSALTTTPPSHRNDNMMLSLITNLIEILLMTCLSIFLHEAVERPFRKMANSEEQTRCKQFRFSKSWTANKICNNIFQESNKNSTDGGFRGRTATGNMGIFTPCLCLSESIR